MSTSSLAEANAKIAALEAQLREREAALAAVREKKRHGGGATIATDFSLLGESDATEDAALSQGYIPQQNGLANCYGTKPCLHTTAAERVKSGCNDAIWDGNFGGKTTFVHETIPNTSISYERPIAPLHNSIDRFVPSIGVEACDLTDVLLLSTYNKAKHLTDAAEQHFHRRLKGAKHAVWLLLGSSIDHDFLKEGCAAFGTQRSTSGPFFGVAYPPPQGLMVDHCWVQPLNLTLAYVNSNGIASTELQRNASLQPIRFEEIDRGLRAVHLGGGPTFITFAGIEWDFKHWRCLFPDTRDEWRATLAFLAVQNREARRRWPSVRATFVRTMFRPTYGTFGCSCCANESHFWHFNHLLRRVSRGGGGKGVGISGNGGGGGGGGGDASDECAPSKVYTLDLQRMMLCNNSVGTCSSRSKWTIDGLHPTRAVNLQFFSLSLQVAADLGERCAPPQTPIARRALSAVAPRSRSIPEGR